MDPPADHWALILTLTSWLPDFWPALSPHTRLMTWALGWSWLPPLGLPCWQWWDRPCPLVPCPAGHGIALSCQLSRPWGAASPCCTLMWKVEKSLISFPKHEKSYEALKLTLICLHAAAHNNPPGGKRTQTRETGDAREKEDGHEMPYPLFACWSSEMF